MHRPSPLALSVAVLYTLVAVPYTVAAVWTRNTTTIQTHTKCNGLPGYTLVYPPAPAPYTNASVCFYVDRAFSFCACLYSGHACLYFGLVLSFYFSSPNGTMESMDESLALVGEARDLDNLVVDCSKKKLVAKCLIKIPR